jgi:hypothetical protein
MPGRFYFKTISHASKLHRKGDENNRRDAKDAEIKGNSATASSAPLRFNQTGSKGEMSDVSIH